ncbi:glycosyltransferase family 2 protein [Cohnella hongkongensis]|uniref:Glycosyltransferase family 2 protein n=1 Tax=Cohnella hongkongensis TaxID=178337 RepID=A0ABV9FF80_9BACL
MSENYPLVTIVTPSYNQGEFIEATIRSVLDQNYPNLQYLVIDGGSKDQTIDILRKYEDRLSWISEKDKGQSDAINKGFKMAKGEIVAWLNSDDTYEPGAIQAAVDYFVKHPEAALVYGEGDIIDRIGNKVKRFEATQEFDLWTLIHKWDYIMQPATFFKRKALEGVGYLNESLHWCMDWELWIKLASNYEVGYINQVIANSREYEDTKTSTGGWKRLKEIKLLMRKYGNMRYPPGLYLYFASTLYMEMGKYSYFKKLASLVMHVIHKMVHKNLPMRYPDGWIGTVYYFAVPKHKKKVDLIVHPEVESLLPVNLTISVNNKEVKRVNADSTNPMEIHLQMEQIDSLNFVKVHLNKSFKPSALDRSSGDDRVLTVRIKTLFK